MSEWFTLPRAHLIKHGILIGQPGTGKTETSIRFAALARKHYDMQVVMLDLKGDEETEQRFVAAMLEVPNTVLRTFPASHWDGWRGDSSALYNRLLGIQDFTEPFYEIAAQKMLILALNSSRGVPRSSKELNALMDLDTLKELYKDDPERSRVLGKIQPQHANGASDRYWTFFETMQGKLDGDLAYDDADAIYIRVPGLALRKEAVTIGRYLIEDFLNYVSARKLRTRQMLFLVDEINTLDLNSETINAFEKARGFGASVIATAQTYSGLGDFRDRIAGSSHLVMTHRCPDPEELIKHAGETERVTSSWGVESGGEATGRGSLSLRRGPAIDANEVKRLKAGELFVMCEGRHQKVRVVRQPVTAEQLQGAERFLQEEEQRRLTRTSTQRSAPPTLPSEDQAALNTGTGPEEM
ncbi:MAG: hypothetical protein ABI413_11455 [Ktedonobacteraceae bacterium]